LTKTESTGNQIKVEFRSGWVLNNLLPFEFEYIKEHSIHYQCSSKLHKFCGSIFLLDSTRNKSNYAMNQKMTNRKGLLDQRKLIYSFLVLSESFTGFL